MPDLKQLKRNLRRHNNDTLQVLERISRILTNSSSEISPFANRAFKMASESKRSCTGPRGPSDWNLKIRVARNTINKITRPHNSRENKLPGKNPPHPPPGIGP